MISIIEILREPTEARGGVDLQRIGVVRVPVRHTHGPVEVCAVSDLEDLVALLTALPLEIAERLPRQ
jgi:putative aminopeptidase FrvX